MVSLHPGVYTRHISAKTGEYQMTASNARDVTQILKFAFYVRMFSLDFN